MRDDDIEGRAPREYDPEFERTIATTVSAAIAPVTERRRLPNRRASETFTLECADLRYIATVSRFADGRVGELFITNTKPASQSDVNVRDAAVAASLAFQFGCALETLRHALLRDSQGRACGPLGVALDLVANGGGEP